MTDQMFLVILFAVFAVCAFSLSMIGANIYSHTASVMNEDYEERIDISYVTEKIRQWDERTASRSAAFMDAQPLIHTEKINGKKYNTYLYQEKGALRELMVREGLDTTTMQGEKIVAAKDFSVIETKQLYHIKIQEVMARYIRTVYTDTAGIRRKYETKSNGTHLILMELMMVLFFFAICGSILLQVFVKAHNISAKAREMTETKNYVTQAAELIEAGAYDIKDFQEYFTQIDGKAGDYQCYYDQDWNEIKKTKARYHMTIKLERQPAKVLGKITMWRENQQIYQLDILRYRQERKDNERS